MGDFLSAKWWIFLSGKWGIRLARRAARPDRLAYGDPPMSRPRATRQKVLEYALDLPEAYLDHPWGEDVAKVGKKVFAFLGTEDGDDPGMSVKLRESHEQALVSPGAEPTGYGLGDAGWVTIPFAGAPPLSVLQDWVEESYRIVASKRLVAELDATQPLDGPR
jgi:predicted DNA-binding protein (MmcQ/YjbR family)